MKPHQLRDDHLAATIELWRSRYSQGYLHQRHYAMKRLLRFIASLGHQTPNTIPKVRRPQPRQSTISADDFRKVLDHAEPWLRCFLLLAGTLGLRFTEAASLTPADYDPNARTITFRKKGGDQHTLPVTSELAQLLDAAPRGQATFLQLLRGDHRLRKPTISADAIRFAFNAAMKRAGVTGITPHDLRRTAARVLYSITKDVVAVQHFLGHRTIATTAEYLGGYRTEDLRPLLERWRPPTEVKQ